MTRAPPWSRLRARQLPLLLLLAAAVGAAADRVEATTPETIINEFDVTNDRAEATTPETIINESDVTNGKHPSDTFNTSSVPDGPLKCSTECSRAESALGATLRFRRGRRYVYEYDVLGSTVVDVSVRDAPGLRIKATAAIDALSDCRMRLHLLRAEVLELVSERGTWAPNERLSQLLERRPLAFSYADGRVDALCPAADEPRWALNVKRGLLSALQSHGRAARGAVQPVLERDISGLCLTHYERRYSASNGGGDAFKLYRSKDTGQCAHRSNVVLPLPAGSALPAAGAKSPLQGELICNQRFEDGVLQDASCREMQTLRPFSVEVSPTTSLGATAHALQSLQLVNTLDIPLGAEDAAMTVPAGPRTSLQFEPEAEDDDEDVWEDEGEAEEDAFGVLQQLAAAADAPADADADADAQRDAPALLRRLTAALRRADFPALDRLFRRTQPLHAHRRLLLETLPGARTSAAAALLTHLAATGSLAPDDVDSWLAARALRGAPSAEELAAFAPLVSGTARARTLLAAGALVHAHCAAAAPGACTRPRSAAADLAGRLERALGPRCRPRPAPGAAPDDRRAQALLRALGNAGLLSGRGANTLRTCYQDAGLPLAVRLAAVDALRRVPCGAVDRAPLLRLFAAPRVDPELRIAAYLGAMRCADAAVFRAVRDAMLREDLGQVSSFVWSHLRNIQTSSLEWKAELSAFLEDSFLKEKFNTESLKYSRNYESSTFFESLATGAAAEANVVFAPSSYLPRSASVNLTVEVFGQPLNLLELGARAEGFEKMVEDAFGPGGYYPDASLRDLLANLRANKDPELENSLARLGGALGDKARLGGDPRASFHARVFGQEVAFSTLGDAPPPFLQALQALRHGLPLGALLQDAAVDYTKAFSLDDAKYTVPTIMGLPLRLSLRAGGLLRVRGSLSVNASREEGVRAAAELAPSASLGAEAAMTLGSQRTARVGVRVRQTARALHFAGADAHVLPGRRVHLALRAPTSRMHLLEARSDLLFVQGGREWPAPLQVQQRSVGACSGATLERALGVRACANATFTRGMLHSNAPPPLFPLSGPASLRVALDKTDSFDRYELHYDMDADDNGVRGLKVRVDTPGSRLDRAVWAEARADPRGPAFSVALRSPAGAAEASVAVSRNDSAAAADAQLRVGGAELLRVAASLRWEGGDGAQGLRLRPELEARAAGSRPLRLAADLGLQPGARYHAHVVLRGAGEPVLLSGELRTQEGGYSVRGEVSCPLLNGSLAGNVSAGPGECASDLGLTYAAADGRRHSAAFHHHFVSGFGLIALNASTQATEFPGAAARLQWALRREDGLREHRLRWERHGRVWKSLQRLRLQRQGPRAHLQALAAFSCPQRRIDYKIDLEHKASERNWSSRAEALLGWKQRYVAGVQLSRSPGPHVVLSAEAATPSVRATLAGRVQRRKHMLGELEGELQRPGGRRSKLSLTGTYKHEGAGGAGGAAGGREVHQVQLELRGALSARLLSHVALGADGVEHSLRFAASADTAATPTYAHLLTYRTHDERHIVDGTVSIAGRNFSGSVEAVRSPTEHSTVIRLPFSSDIVISSKFLMSSPSGLESQDYDALLLEVSWDKKLHPSNYVAFNTTFNGAHSRVLLEYPNQNILWEVITDPGHLSLNFGWDKDRKLQSEIRWILETYEGMFSAWIHTPFEGLEKQTFMFNYTADGQGLILHSSAACLGRRQSVSARAQRRGDALNAVLTAAGDLAPELHLSLEHDPQARTGFTADSDDNLQVSLLATRRGDGRVAALEARVGGKLLPLPECSLSYAHPAHALSGDLRCDDFLKLHFDADAHRPKGNFSAWMPRLGYATFDFEAAADRNSAAFDSRDPSGGRALSVSLQHWPEGERNFSLALEAQWPGSGVRADVEARSGAVHTRYRGAVSGDLQMALTHVTYHPADHSAHFSTEVSLPGGVTANHTFQGQDLLNWASAVRVSAGERQGSLQVRQALNSTGLLHRWDASSGTRSARALLSMGFGPDEFPLQVLLQGPQGEPIGLDARLSMQPLLRLSYPPHALQFSGRIDLDDPLTAGGFSAELLLPQSDPMNVTASYSLGRRNVSANAAARWSSETLTADTKLIYEDGIDKDIFKLTMDVEHSVSGELLHLNLSLKTPDDTTNHLLQASDISMSSHIFGRVIGKEFRVNTSVNLMYPGLGEVRIDVETPFTNWTSLNFSYEAMMDSADAGKWTYSVSKEDKTARFVAKAKLSPSHSLVDATLQYDDALVASFAGHYDRSDLANQTMEMKCQVRDQISHLKGSFEQRDNNTLSGGASWHVLLITPLEGLAHTETELKFANSEGAQELLLLVRKDAWLLQANGSCVFGQQRSHAALDVLLPTSLAVRRLGATLDYRQMSPSDHLVVSTVTCDDQVLETNVTVAASDGELAAFLETRSSRDGLGPLSARFNVGGRVRGQGKALLFELDGAGGRRFNLSAQLRAPSALRVDARLAASAAAPSFGQRRFLDTALRYDLEGAEVSEGAEGAWRRRFASLAVNVSARAYALEGEVKTAADRLRANASLAVRLPRGEGVRAHAHYDARARGSLSADASVATVAGRDLLQAALALNDSLLTAQVVSEPLGVRALTVVATWAPRAHSGFYARLHLPERQLSVEATAARDLSVCELLLSASGAGGGRLHAKYDASAPRRNLTAVVVRGADTLTLSATHARDEQGTHGDFYLSASRLGRVHALARLHTPLGSQLDLFVDDRDFNRVLHTSLASTAKEVAVFTESQFRDLQKLNISIRFDVVPTFNHVGLDMEYIAEQTKFPAKLSAKIDRETAFFKLHHFIYKLFPEDMEAILTYDKLLDTPSNPSFVFVLSVNNTKIFRSSAHFIFDWEKEIQIDLKMNSQLRDKKWKLGVGCRCETKFPATVSLNVTDQTGALVAMDGRAVAAERGGFTYRLALNTDYGRQRREAQVEYYPKNPLLMSVDTNATSGAQTRRYFAALKMDVERALLRLDLVTPVVGYENLTLNWRREDESFALDAHTTYPGFERVGVRARFYLQEGPAKAASLYVERDGSTVGGALYLERVEGLLNVSCELELHGTGGGKSGLNFWYDVRGPLKSVEVKLLDTCVHRVAATFATEPGLELHAIADINKQASSLDVSYNPKHVAFRGVVVGKTVADFNFQRVDSGNDTSVDAKFMSSFVAHPLKLRYDYNLLENPNPEIRMFMTVTALEKTSTIDFRMPADDSPNMSYNIKVDLPDGEWTAEAHIREEGAIEAKTSVVGYGVELLHAEMHESSPGVKALSVSVMDGQFVDAKLTFDVSGTKKFSDLHVLRDGSSILNAHVHVDVKEESVEVIGTADVPNLPLRGFAFNYTLGRGDVLRKEYPEVITDDAGVGHWLYFVWQTESERMATDLHAVFGPQTILEVSVKDGKTHLLLFNHKFYTLVKESTETQLDMQLKLKELEWKVFGVCTSRERVSGLRLEAVTPWLQLQRLVFNLHRNDAFDLKLVTTSHNRDAQLTAKITTQDGTFANAELSLPHRPKVAAVLSAKGGRSPAMTLEVTSGEHVLKAEVGAEVHEGGRVEAQARLTSPWSSPWALEGTYEQGVARVRTTHGARTVAEAEGKMDFQYERDVSFNLALEGAVLDRKVRAAAGWSRPMEGGSGQRHAHLEWQSEGAVIKFRFDAEPDRSGSKFSGTMAVVADAIALHGSANGTWPEAVAISVRTGNMEEAYEASYDFRAEGHTTKGAVVLKTLVWEPLEIKVSLTDDKTTGRQEAIFSSRGYHVFASCNKNGISDARLELSDTNGVILSLKNIVIDDTYNGEVAWREKSTPKKVEFSLRMKQNGKFELRSPWNMYALANWNHVNKTNGQALLHWNGMDLNAEYDRSLSFSRAFLGSPWGSAHLRQVRGEEQGSIAFMVDDSTGDKQVLYAKYEYDDQMRFLLHVWREALHKVEVSLSPDLRRVYALVASPRLNVDAGVEARADGWGARLRTEGELAPAVDARLSSDDAHFNASAQLPGVDLQAALTRLPVARVSFSYAAPALRASLSAEGGARPALRAWASAEGVGEARLEALREAQAARLAVDCAAAGGGGRRRSAQVGARWGGGNFSVEAAAGAFNAGLALGASPTHLHVHVGNATLLVRNGLALAQAPDGRRHSLEWRVARERGRVEADVQLDCAALLPERAQLHLQLGPHHDGDGGGAGAEVRLAHGEHRHAVVLRFRRSPRSALEARVDADGHTLLALNSSLAVHEEQVDAALHLRLRDTDNSLEVTHRLAFPVLSSISVRSPLLLAAERVWARLRVDGESLEAEAARGGEWSARRFVAVRGAYSPQRRSASLAFDSSDLSHVRSFGVAGALHRDDLGFDADAQLATGDGAAVVLRAAAALSADALKAEGNIISRTETSDKKYSAGLTVPLRFAGNSTETTLQALLTLPDAEYLFQAAAVSTQASLSASAVARAPGFDSRATLTARRAPSFALAAQLDSPLQGLERLRLSVNERVANSDALAHYIQWGSSRVELRHRFLLQDRLIVSEVQLTTPFAGHERYALQLAYQNGEQKRAVARVAYPGLERDLGLELDYRVRGLFNASLRAAFNAPFLPGLRSAALALTHVLDLEESVVYVAAAEGEVNGRTAGVNVSVEAWREGASAFRGDFEAERDGERAWLRVRGDLERADGDAFVSVDVSCTGASASAARVEARWGQDSGHSPVALLATVTHHDRLLLDLNATAGRNIVDIICVNPVKPVSFRLAAFFFTPLDVGAELGWEQDGELKTRVGLGAKGNYDSQRRSEEMRFFLVLPGRSARATFVGNDGAWEHSASVTWAGNRTLGYAAAAGAAEARLRVDLPSARALEARVEHARGDEGAWRHSAAVLWDAARDRSRRVGYELRSDAAEGLVLTLRHPVLGDGAVVGVRGALGVRDERLRAECDVRAALLREPGLDWRAGAAFDLRRRAGGGGGRAAVAFHVADRRLGREARAALDAALDAASGAALLLNVTYTPVERARGPLATLVTEVRAAPTLLLLRARAPDAALEMSARAWAAGAELLARVDDRDAVRAKVELEAAERAVSAELELGGGLRYRARAVAPHRRRVSAELWVEAEGAEPLPAARLALELKTPRLLSVRARWPPQMHLTQVWQVVQQELERVSPAAAAAADAHARLWQTRWDARVAWPQRREWRAFTRTELDAVGKDVLALADDAAGLFPDVAALLDDARGPAAAFWGSVRRGAEACGHAALKWARAALDAALQVALVASDALGLDDALPALGDALTGVKEQAVAAHAAVLERAVALLEGTGAALGAAGQRARAAATLAHRRLVQPATELALQATDHLAHAFFELSRRFTVLSKTIADHIMEVKELLAVQELFSEAAIWLEGPFRESLGRLFETIENVAVLVLDDLQESLRLLWERVQEAAPALSPTVRELYHQALWVLETYVATPRNAAALEAWSQQRRALRPEKGELVLEQPLPVDWEGFDRAPRFDQLRQLGAGPGPGPAHAQHQDTKERLLYTLKELTAQSPRALAERALSHSLPAFSAVGQLLGARHVVTFDGNAFELPAARCSYLLAGDLTRNTFAIIVHFNGQAPKRTFTVATPYHAVHVSEEYAVRVDGQPLELPARATPFLSVRRTEEALEVAAPGFAFRCRVDRHACSVRVSSWQLGRVRGLLGSFDRERSGDLEVMGADAAAVGHAPADAWRVGRCRDDARPPAPPAPLAPRAHDSPACKQVLESASSPLSECFARVDPSPYVALCAVAGPCDAALAYKEACQLRTWFRPSAPPECESCRGPDGAWMAAGASWRARAAPVADVAVVVQSGCAGRVAERVPEALPRLAAALRARGVQDARFALLSFGGAGARGAADQYPPWLAEWVGEAAAARGPAPRLHTAGGRVWADAQDAQKTLHRVLHGIPETEIPQGHLNSTTKTYSLQQQREGEPWRAAAGEAERALAAGAGLRARAGAGRAVVLLQCGACQREASPPLAEALAAAGGVPLHVLRSDVLAAPAPGKASRPVPGAAVAFAPSDDYQRGLKVVPQGSVAKDACTGAALQGAGSVTEAARGAWPQAQAARALDAWAEHVARSLRLPQLKQPCAGGFRCAPGGGALCVGEDVVPQNSEEADEQFLQFLQ